jgi:hypothetical protein
VGDVAPGRQVVSPVTNADVTWDDLCCDDPVLGSWCADRWLGAWRPLRQVPSTFGETRAALHRLAEHVIAPARHRANGKIGLRYTYRGFGTPFFGDDAQVRVDGGEIVLQKGERERRASIHSVREAAAFVGVEPGAPADVYHPSTSMDAEARLPVDPAASRFLGDWLGFAASVLEQLRSEASADDVASRVQLWPEHFDLAFELGDEGSGRRAGYGASPGDENHAEPYFYVVPWAGAPRDDVWNDRFFRGASLSFGDLVASSNQREAALSFLRERKRVVQASS